MRGRRGRAGVRRATAAVATIAMALAGLTGAGGALPGAHAAPVQDAACGATFPAYAPPAPATGSALLSNVAIPMSDGVVLRADVVLPTGIDGPFPTSLTITGYGKTSPISGLGGGGATGLTRNGYAVMTVDDRGTGASGGSWDSWGPRTVADYTEVLDWIVAQPWSDGRIGITGGSYMGITSLYAAASAHPAVKAVFATVPMADGYRDIVLGGGQINTAFIPLWMGLVTALALPTVPDAETLVDHLLGVGQFQLPVLAETVLGGATAHDGPFWRQRSPIEVVDRITVPTFLVGGLDDIFQRGTPMLYERLADHTDARLVLGPWTHGTTGTGLPRDGVPNLNALLVQWFDAHVRGLDTGADCIPAVTQYVRGHERYESTTSWPAPGLTAQRWHLREAGGLTPAAPGPGEGGQSFVELPITGICTRSTNQWLIGLVDGTGCPQDQRFDEAIGSVTYTSEPLTEELLINGPIQADVWVTTTRADATVSVAVSDVAPDGSSRGLTNGLLTASHRAVDPARSRMLDGQSIQPWHPFTAEAALGVRPGEPVLLPIEVLPTSAALAPGHRLRVTIAPFDVPHALPPLPAGLDAVGGTVQVLSDADHPSSIVLPVQDAAGGAGSALTAARASTAAGPAGATAPDAAGPAGAPASSAAAGGDAAATSPISRLPETGGGLDAVLPLLALAAVLLTRRLRSS